MTPSNSIKPSPHPLSLEYGTSNKKSRTVPVVPAVVIPTRSTVVGKPIVAIDRIPIAVWQSITIPFLELSDILHLECTSRRYYETCLHGWSVIKKRDLIDCEWSNSKSISHPNDKARQDYLFTRILLSYIKHPNVTRFQSWIEKSKYAQKFVVDQNGKKKLVKTEYSNTLLWCYLNSSSNGNKASSDLQEGKDSGDTTDNDNIPTDNNKLLTKQISVASKSSFAGDLLLAVCHRSLKRKNPHFLSLVEKTIKAGTTYAFLFLDKQKILDYNKLLNLSISAADAGDFRPLEQTIGYAQIKNIPLDNPALQNFPPYNYILGISDPHLTLIEQEKLFDKAWASQAYRNQTSPNHLVQISICKQKLGKLEEAWDIIRSAKYTFINNQYNDISTARYSYVSIDKQAFLIGNALKEKYKRMSVEKPEPKIFKELYQQVLKETSQYLIKFSSNLHFEWENEVFLESALQVQLELNSYLKLNGYKDSVANKIADILIKRCSDSQFCFRDFPIDYIFEVGRIKYHNNDLITAEKVFNIALEKALPSNYQCCIEARIDLARTMYKLGKYVEADKHFTVILTKPNMAIPLDLFVDIGTCKYQAGNLLGGESLMSQAFSLYPVKTHADIEFLKKLANIKIDKACYIESEEILEAIVSTPVEMSCAYHLSQMALTKLRVNKLDQAEFYLKRALEQYTLVEAVPVNTLQFAAEIMYELASKASPSDIFGREERLTYALRYSKRAIDILKENASASLLFFNAKILFLKDNIAEGDRFIRQALLKSREGPGNREMSRNICLFAFHLYDRKKMFDSSKHYLRMVIDSYSPGEIVPVELLMKLSELEQINSLEISNEVNSYLL